MAQPSYIPTQIALLNTWVQNFSSLITANPSLYGLQPADAVTIASYVGTFTSAYALSSKSAPATRTSPAISATAGAQAAMLGIIRPYAQQIRNNAGVSNMDKLALGLNVPSSSRTPILVPVTSPLLAILAATSGSFTMKFQDPNTVGTRRSKPPGARAVQIVAAFSAVAAALPTNPDAAVQIEVVTKQPFAVMFATANNGMVATLWARWFGRDTSNPGGTGYGPWSIPVSQVVSF